MRMNRFGAWLGVTCLLVFGAKSAVAQPTVKEAPRPVVRMGGALQLGGVPALVSPACGVTLTDFPRKLNMSWKPLGGSTSYDIEVDCMSCRQTGEWDSQVGPPYSRHVPSGTSASMEFWGDKLGRWRVRANRGTMPEPWSGWCEFTFKTSALSRMLVHPPGLDRRPDITGTTGGMTVAGNGFAHVVKWNGTQTLEESEAIVRSNGECAFNIHYDMANVGASPTAPYPPPAPGARFTNVLYDDTTPASKQSDLYLAVGAVEGIDTQAYLAPGTHTLKLSLDEGNAIHEANETNNTFTITYVLNGTCGAK